MTMYYGMNSATGKAITDTEHLNQSVKDILITPQGSLIARREYGSLMTVEDLMADIATIFHWPPSVTDVMSLSEVLEWRHKAILRSGASDE
jgi:hypothetical protein